MAKETIPLFYAGEVRDVPVDRAQAALAAGYRKVSDQELTDWDARAEWNKNASGLEKVGTAAFTAAESAAAAGVGMVTSPFGVSGEEALAKAYALGGDSAEEEANIRRRAQEFSGAATAGELAGGVMGGLGAAKLGSAALKGAGLAGTAAGRAAGVAGMGAEGALGGLTAAERQAFLDNRELSAEEAVFSGALGAALGAGILLAGRAVAKGARTAKRAGSEALGRFQPTVEEASVTSALGSSPGQAASVFRDPAERAARIKNLESLWQKGSSYVEPDKAVIGPTTSRTGALGAVERELTAVDDALEARIGVRPSLDQAKTRRAVAGVEKKLATEAERVARVRDGFVAKEKKAYSQVRKFKTKLDDIEARAAREGLGIPHREQASLASDYKKALAEHSRMQARHARKLAKEARRSEGFNAELATLNKSLPDATDPLWKQRERFFDAYRLSKSTSAVSPGYEARRTGAIIGGAAGMAGGGIGGGMGILALQEGIHRYGPNMTVRATLALRKARQKAAARAAEAAMGRTAAKRHLAPMAKDYAKKLAGRPATYGQLSAWFSEASEEVDSLATNPEDVTERLGTELSWMEEADPSLVMDASVGTGRAVQYLQSVRPQGAPRSLAMPNGPRMKPSRREIERYYDVHEALGDPTVIYLQLANGDVKPHVAEAIRNVYPEFHAELAGQVTQQLALSRDMPPQRVLMAMEQILGAGGTIYYAMSPKFQLRQAQYVQQSGAAAPPQPAPKAPGRPKGSPTLSQQYRSQTQRAVENIGN